MRRVPALAALVALSSLLGGCNVAILDPKGPIGVDEKSIILLATGLMLIVVVPVICMTFAFAWRYRESSNRARFAPNWAHSTRIELVVWLVPCLIIAVLGTVTWTSTHKLDPYQPIASSAEPIDVDVVSLDWKWLFIYPKLKVASVNELAFPAGVPVRFRLTSDSVMNSFFIPHLGSQIYTMPGMETRLNLMASAPGDYTGISANYSGDGFSDMSFKARAMTQHDFADWLQKVRASSQELTLAAYRRLAQPSEKVPVAYYGAIETNVYHDVLNKCANGARCTDETMSLAMASETFGTNVGLCAIPKSKGVQ